MKTIKGPGIFLAQFMGDKAPFNDLSTICKWAADLGFVGVQLPTWDPRCIDLQKAAESKTYADEVKGIVEAAGLQITSSSVSATCACSPSFPISAFPSGAVRSSS
jgi:sugar phosphate isomerase/epimerase